MHDVTRRPSASGTLKWQAMYENKALREKLAKVEELFRRAGSPGERVAAGVARDRLRKRLGDDQLKRRGIEQELKVTLPDAWSVKLFCAVCNNHNIRPFRYKRQRKTTVMVIVEQPAFERVVWPEFKRLQDELQSYFESFTQDLIRRNFRGHDKGMSVRR